MNVQQVIEALQKFPADMEVRVWDEDGVAWEVLYVRERSEWAGRDKPEDKFVIIS